MVASAATAIGVLVVLSLTVWPKIAWAGGVDPTTSTAVSKSGSGSGSSLLIGVVVSALVALVVARWQAKSAKEDALAKVEAAKREAEGAVEAAGNALLDSSTQEQVKKAFDLFESRLETAYTALRQGLDELDRELLEWVKE